MGVWGLSLSIPSIESDENGLSSCACTELLPLRSRVGDAGADPGVSISCDSLWE